jgi:hypothetical protein
MSPYKKIGILYTNPLCTKYVEPTGHELFTHFFTLLLKWAYYLFYYNRTKRSEKKLEKG